MTSISFLNLSISVAFSFLIPYRLSWCFCSSIFNALSRLSLYSVLNPFVSIHFSMSSSFSFCSKFCLVRSSTWIKCYVWIDFINSIWVWLASFVFRTCSLFYFINVSIWDSYFFIFMSDCFISSLMKSFFFFRLSFKSCIFLFSSAL